MMIHRRLIGMVPSSKAHIAKAVLSQWLGLISSLIAMFVLGALVRYVCVRLSARESHLLSRLPRILKALPVCRRTPFQQSGAGFFVFVTAVKPRYGI